ncbi:MAG: carbohydrate ABC transporter substrate-binding protein [Okeania sp. SIO2C9]|uniref:ABC transporter substrate-binding protein n=1 Tax=Okeania sp. SIO2C9 TaxID=2607791 RepID=UPI0013C10C2E|nr:ABC transporter substrate-binding protein [Okeania sp. SIO2C9]NEQ78658.1 carbohydrate ABC transporter substrate-binding protein [Okeania sp. SIO2C9]
MRRREFNRLFWFSVGLGLASCQTATSSSKQSNIEYVNESNNLSIWWQQGFYPEETDALEKIITEWEEKSGIKIDLTIIPQKDILREMESALISGDLPDIFYSGIADLTIIPRLAWNNQLADVSEVIEPLKDLYSESVVSGVNYQNNVAGKRSYYAVPIMQSAIHIHYWQDICF